MLPFDISKKARWQGKERMKHLEGQRLSRRERRAIEKLKAKNSPAIPAAWEDNND